MMELSVASCSEGDEPRSSSARKRLRLNAVLDRLTTQVEKKTDPATSHAGSRLSSSEPTLIAEVDFPDCRFTSHDPCPSDPILNRRRSLSDGELQQVQQRIAPELKSPTPSLSNSPSGERLSEEHPLDLSVRTDPLNSVCPLCGQVFWLNDRLAKHIASHHRGRRVDPASRTYVCHVCHRAFVRSDMLTRHMRLHTGVKPYTCRVCGQVFSRSDHLSTHQRTHTGEKPYTCPQCPYAACRRDMITRHMRTHARYGSILLEETSEQQHDEMYIYRLSGLHVSSPCIAHT